MSKPRRPPARKVDGVLLLDKPSGMTSNSALQAARRLFNAAKGGHTGTLDPLATGLLPLCFGEATKFAGELLNANKSYRATLRLGVTTDTADSEGQVRETRPVDLTAERLEAALKTFVGEIDQVPPMHSALKRDGKPLYAYARAGVEVEREPRRITVYGIRLMEFSGERVVVDVDCSKGTYIRTLAEDIGEALGCGAHLTALRRTRIGELSVDAAATLDELAALTPDVRDTRLAAADALLSGLPRVSLTEAESLGFRNGQSVRRPGQAGDRYRAYDSAGALIGLGTMSDDGRLMPKRLVTQG